MALDPNIALGFQPPQLQSPLATVGQVQALKNQQQQAQMGGLELQQKQTELAQHQAVIKAFQQSGGDTERAIGLLESQGNPEAFTLRQHQAAVQKLVDDHAKATRDDALYQNDMQGRDAQQVLNAPDALKPYAYQAQRLKWVAKNPALDAQLPQTWTPDLVPTLQGIVSHSQSIKDQAETLKNKAQTTQAEEATKKSQLEQQKIAALLPGDVAKQGLDITKATQETTGTQPISPYQQGTLKQGEERIVLAKDRVNLQRELVSGSALTDGAIDTAADLLNQTGTMIPLGQGKVGNKDRERILNRAAERLQPGTTIAANKADYGADVGSLKKLQAQRDAVGAFEQTATKNLDLFLSTAKNVMDTGSPLVNLPLRMAAGKLTGSPDQAAYNAARQVAINEVAKVTSNPNLSGTLSDAARKEVEAFNPDSATLAQTYRVAQVLKQDMANRRQELDRGITEIKGRISGKPQETAAPKATHRYNPATGKIEAMP